MPIANNVFDLIGNTPLVALKRFSQLHGLANPILAKAEFFNVNGSVKDRIGLSMILAAEKEGKLTPDAVIIEPTSGNTGISLASLAASRGYKIILTMPESMSIERRKVLQHFGAELVLTPAANGMKGAIEKAKELAAQTPNSFIPFQFANPANPQIHFETTGPEIWSATEGKIDTFIAGIGTGGTLTGAGKYLREQNPNIEIIPVEPEDSPVLSGGQPGPHKIQGIGAGFVPEVLDTSLYTEVIKVSNEDAIATAKLLAKQEGLLVGISAGANVFASLQYALQGENKNKDIVTILPDTGERYLSTALFE
ncbi:MAG: cysteine synthase A [Candidatus Absconditabacteria bacterium]|nr:cysteine synthase A [Candidatus Absconditabacteria bacterium]MDD3867972.1 cysteine synthase A [Candidatus Absconditabacteria bacterium]MDD4714219.1 cysteine synthase A [Candidatus Absconditabacteria bacterium]